MKNIVSILFIFALNTALSNESEPNAQVMMNASNAALKAKIEQANQSAQPDDLKIVKKTQKVIFYKKDNQNSQE